MLDDAILMQGPAVFAQEETVGTIFLAGISTMSFQPIRSADQHLSMAMVWRVSLVSYKPRGLADGVWHPVIHLEMSISV